MHNYMIHEIHLLQILEWMCKETTRFFSYGIACTTSITGPNLKVSQSIQQVKWPGVGWGDVNPIFESKYQSCQVIKFGVVFIDN